MNRPSRFAIAKYWARHEFVSDLGEPSCFACGYYQEHWDNQDSASERWNRSRLERAHIIGHSIGGSCKVENFLLLCRQCHKEAPMTNSRELFLNWARKREDWMSRCMRDWSSAFKRVGITDQDLTKVASDDPKAFRLKFMKHLRQIKYDKHPQLIGFPGDGDTVALIVQDYIEQNQHVRLS